MFFYSSDSESPKIYVYDAQAMDMPLKVLEKLHMKPVTAMKVSLVKYYEYCRFKLIEKKKNKAQIRADLVFL